MTADERREALVHRVHTHNERWKSSEYLTESEAEYVVNDLLAYFDEHEPLVADAIRYGFDPKQISEAEAVSIHSYTLPDFIAYPERVKPRWQ